MSEPDLKPCPCCGADPVRRPYEAEAADEIHKLEMGVVRCLNCGLTMECNGQTFADLRWNNRVRQKCMHELAKECLESATADFEAAVPMSETKGDQCS